MKRKTLVTSETRGNPKRQRYALSDKDNEDMVDLKYIFNNYDPRTMDTCWSPIHRMFTNASMPTFQFIHECWKMVAEAPNYNQWMSYLSPNVFRRYYSILTLTSLALFTNPNAKVLEHLVMYYDPYGACPRGSFEWIYDCIDLNNLPSSPANAVTFICELDTWWSKTTISSDRHHLCLLLNRFKRNVETQQALLTRYEQQGCNCDDLRKQYEIPHERQPNVKRQSFFDLVIVTE